jgi:hypothetical protein
MTKTPILRFKRPAPKAWTEDHILKTFDSAACVAPLISASDFVDLCLQSLPPRSDGKRDIRRQMIVRGLRTMLAKGRWPKTVRIDGDSLVFT